MCWSNLADSLNVGTIVVTSSVLLALPRWSSCCVRIVEALVGLGGLGEHGLHRRDDIYVPIAAALAELLYSEILELLQDRRCHEVHVGTAELSIRSRSRSHSRDRSHPRYSPQ